MSPEELEAAVTAQTWLDARLNRELVVQGLLLPAIETIAHEHEPRLRDFAFLVLHSPLVPAGRKDLFARGLLGGLRKDFVEAAHYLLPQIENSLRHVLMLYVVWLLGVGSAANERVFCGRKFLSAGSCRMIPPVALRH